MRATKIIIFPVWQCQLSCDYCNADQWEKPDYSKFPTAKSWIEALRRHFESNEWVGVDFSGGEPLLYPQIIELVTGLADLDVGWAMTSNLINKEAVEKLTQLPNNSHCIQINASVHKDNRKIVKERGRMLEESGYRIQYNLVDHPSAPEFDLPATKIPYQDWPDNAIDGKKRLCDAGTYHFAIGPQGDVWNCQVLMGLGEEPIGNIFGDFKPKPKMICSSGCSTCYTGNPQVWSIKMKEVDNEDIIHP